MAAMERNRMLREILEKIRNLPDVTEAQETELSFIISDIYEVIWDNDSEASEG